MYARSLITLAVVAVVASGCRVNEPRDGDRDPEGGGAAVQPAAPGQDQAAWGGQQGGPLRLEVDVDARELHVFRGDQRVETHPVAVGSREWPTPTGEWRIGQVVLNPRWVPPDQEWAEDEEPKEPGDPENPLGQAQLVYDAPNSIHGTNEPESLGQAVSHGSIRVSNEVAVHLARLVLEAGGAQRDEAFFRQAEQNRQQRQEVSVPNPVPIRIYGQAGGQAGQQGRQGQQGRGN